MATARKEGRYGHRDATAILIAFRHGLRVSELCDLSWYQIDITCSTVTVLRAKGGEASTHFLNGSMRIPTNATTHSNGSRPDIPIDRDQCGAGADSAVG